ncbi:MAG: hypothetical protein H0V45_14700 [Actinobacteria bacterium]|nr:hypothetical protein [Actinomycetota bacterium]
MRRALLLLLLVVLAASLGPRAASAANGGTYGTTSGEQVQVLSSDAYPVDDARNQTWAEFLSRLVHGDELATVTLYLAPPAELSRICGRDALAC